MATLKEMVKDAYRNADSGIASRVIRQLERNGLLDYASHRDFFLGCESAMNAADFETLMYEAEND